jgi:cytidylate kinase
MNQITSSAYLAESIEQISRHWETRRQSHVREMSRGLPTQPHLAVAVAREVGTLGTIVAQEVGARLKWPVYDRELLELIANEIGSGVNLVEEVDEKPQYWFREAIESFMNVSYVSKNTYVRYLVKTIAALGSFGDCVIVGRGAAQILPAESTLRVRLIAPLKDRVAVMKQFLGVSEKEAARRVASMDRERAVFIRRHFFKDPADPLNYDLVLNTSRFSPSECAKVIVEALHQRQDRAKESWATAAVQ